MTFVFMIAAAAIVFVGLDEWFDGSRSRAYALLIVWIALYGCYAWWRIPPAGGGDRSCAPLYRGAADADPLKSGGAVVKPHGRAQ